jgi:hypothetical protein
MEDLVESQILRHIPKYAQTGRPVKTSLMTRVGALTAVPLLARMSTGRSIIEVTMPPVSARAGRGFSAPAVAARTTTPS